MDGGRGRAAPPRPLLETWLLLAAILLVNLNHRLSMNRFGIVMLFAPAVILFFPFFALRILSNPVRSSASSS